MFKVEQLSDPNMTVHVNSGTIFYKNAIINFDEQDSEVILTPTIGTWIVALSINQSGQLVYTYGVQSTEKRNLPVLPNECFHIALLEVTASTVNITNDDIYDLRFIFNFSENNDTSCICKCTATGGLTNEEKAQLQEFYNKYAEIQLDIEKIKLALQPQKAYKILSDSGLEYELHCNDAGELYTKRVGYDDNPKEDEHHNYKFVYNDKQINIENITEDDYIDVNVKIQSFDALNENMSCTLILSCINSTINNSNYENPYRENEFRITNLVLTKSGYYEHFLIKFHDEGNHTLKLSLYDNKTQEKIDNASILYDVNFYHNSQD
jgi:hypothetical protein